MSSIETLANIRTTDQLRPLTTHIVSSFSTNGSGTGATFEVIVDPGSEVRVVVTNKGSGYATNNTITIADVHLDGKDTGTLSFEIATISNVF